MRADTASEFVARVRRSLQAPARNEAGDHVLNPDMGPYAFAKHPPRDAAVLIPVIDRPAGTQIVLTQRTEHLAAHAGQIALPGGKIDPHDGGPVNAALREAEEEIGLSRDLVAPAGLLPTYLTGSGYNVVPVVARIDPQARFSPEPGEVADVFEVPLGFLMDETNHQRQSRLVGGKPRYFYAIPYGERYIWGVTAGILRLLYETVYR